MKKWKKIFCRQLSTLSFWNELFQNSDNSDTLLTRSDATMIIKIAQSEVYDSIIDKIKDRIDNDTLTLIIEEAEKHQKTDISAIGMWFNGEQIKEGVVE